MLFAKSFCGKFLMKKRKGTIWTNSNPIKTLIFATMKNFQLTRRQLSKTFANFAVTEVSVPSVKSLVYAGGGHQGEQTGFYPSENLENSSELRQHQGSSESGKRPKDVPPVDCINRILWNATNMHTYRCELIFILSFTGFPEPSDEECDECSHFFLVRMLIGVVVNDCRDNDRPLSDENNMKKTVIVWHKVFLAAITLSKHKEVEIIPSLSKIKKNEYNEKLLEIITRGALPCRNDRMF